MKSVPRSRLSGQFKPVCGNLKELANLKPRTRAIMDGSSCTGDCARALDDLNVVLREVFGPPE